MKGTRQLSCSKREPQSNTLTPLLTLSYKIETPEEENKDNLLEYQKSMQRRAKRIILETGLNRGSNPRPRTSSPVYKQWVYPPEARIIPLDH